MSTLTGSVYGCCRCILRQSLLVNKRMLSTTQPNYSLSASHYDVLGVSRLADQKEIKDAFLNKSKQLHPDVNRQDPKNHEKFVRLNEAYSVLGKTSSRREYDVTLAYKIRHHQDLARYASSAHYGGSYSRPDTGSKGSGYEWDSDERMHWDDSYFYTDKNKGRVYTGDNVEKKPMSHFIAFVIVLFATGCGLFFSAIYWSGRIRDRSHRKNAEYLREVRAQASARSREEQVALMLDRFREHEIRSKRNRND